MLEGMPNYRSGVDGLRVSNSTKGGITFAASTTVKMASTWSQLSLGVEAVDGDPYARFVATSHHWWITWYEPCFFHCRKERRYHEKVGRHYGMGKLSPASAVAKKDFYVVVNKGNQTEPDPSRQNQLKPL